MKKHILLVVAALLSCLGLWAGEPVRVACVGNSITYGAFIPNREQNSYPAQLQAYLGSGYEVRNFGVSGRTLLTKGDYPYVQTAEYKQSLEYRPDVVLIKLGTNDSKPQNFKHIDEFSDNYRSLIRAYQALPSRPRIILLTPVRCFLPPGSEIDSARIAGVIHPKVEALAWENGLEIINLANLYGNVWEQHILPDKLHPSSIGAGRMAGLVGDYLLRTSAYDRYRPAACNPLFGGRPFNFHGHAGFDFELDGVACKVVRPHVEASGRPWVLRARFWGHEPQADIALLEQGFHIAYCDVAELFGSEKAMERWDRFYRHMREAGFSRKVVLEGMSRGGQPVYNWASRNADKVACIYADAPVMDLRSWPMGKGTSARYEAETVQLLAAYGFADEAEACRKLEGNIDFYAARLAKASIPILHVVGDADDVVPVAENTAVFEQKMKELNAPITVIHKPGVGHHPHSLSNPSLVVRFVLSATGLLRNRCTHPVPGNEYRSAAGWVENQEWHSVANDISQTLAGRSLKLLLLGNSITQGWGGSRKAVAYKPGKQAMDRLLGEGTWESAGISGDCTQHLLWRVLHGNYGACSPQNVVIAIGVNNLADGDSPREVAEGIIRVAEAACKEFDNSRIFLLGMLPAGISPDSELRVRSNEVHRLLASHRFERAEYTDPTSWFVRPDGSLDMALYGGDGIHLTAQGYAVFARHLSGLMGR